MNFPISSLRTWNRSYQTLGYCDLYDLIDVSENPIEMMNIASSANMGSAFFGDDILPSNGPEALRTKLEQNLRRVESWNNARLRRVDTECSYVLLICAIQGWPLDKGNNSLGQDKESFPGSPNAPLHPKETVNYVIWPASRQLRLNWGLET
jgi:hypothetical protein